MYEHKGRKVAKQFVKEFRQLDRSKHVFDNFRNFVEMTYCAYAKVMAPTEERAEELEDRYMRIVHSYRNKDTVREMPKFLGMVMQGIQYDMDFFGTVAGEMELLDASKGQFFTPMGVCQLMAQMTIGKNGEIPEVARNGYVLVGEPACGAGAMLLAFGQQLRELHYKPEWHMMAQATDVSPLAYHMCYIQCTLAGIPAFVRRGNTITQEMFEGAYTFPSLIFYHRHGHFLPPIQDKRMTGTDEIVEPPPPPRREIIEKSGDEIRKQQMSLF